MSKIEIRIVLIGFFWFLFEKNLYLNFVVVFSFVCWNTQGESSHVNGMNDAENFKIVKEALHVMEIEDEEQEALFLLVAVVIHLGNIEFTSGDGGRARINNPVLVSTIAKVCPWCS